MRKLLCGRCKRSRASLAAARVRRERPRPPAAEQRDELAPPHVRPLTFQHRPSSRAEPILQPRRTIKSRHYSLLSDAVQSHHIHRCPAEDCIWIADRLTDLIMIVAFRDDQPNRLASGLEGSREVPCLALKLGSFQRSDRKRKRSVNPVDVTLRRKLLLHFVRESYNFDRSESRTGLRSYIPLPNTPPLRMLRGRPCSFHSVVTTQPARWLPDERLQR